MITFRLETVFVGDIAQGDGFAIGIRITEGSLNMNNVFLAIFSFHDLTFFFHMNAVSGLVIIVVRTVRIWSVNIQSQAGLCLWFHWRKRKHCGHAEKYGDLEKIFYDQARMKDFE